jgi:hypothetical protein
MRIATVAFSALSLLGVLVLGVFHLKLRKEHDETKEQLWELRHSLAEMRDEAPSQREPRWDLPAPTAAPRLAQPVAGTQAPAAPGSREEIQRIVAQQIAEDREQERIRRDERREELARRFHDHTATRLGLSPEEGQKFEETLSEMQREWYKTVESLRKEMRTTAEVQLELDALSERTQTALQALLGPERFAKLKEMNPGPAGGGPNNPNRWLLGLAGRMGPQGPMLPLP